MKYLMTGILGMLLAQQAAAQNWSSICNDPMQKIMYQAECLQHALTGSVQSATVPGDGPESVAASRPGTTEYQGNGEAPCAGPAEACGGQRPERILPPEIEDQETVWLGQRRSDLQLRIYQLMDSRDEAWYYQDYQTVDQIDYTLNEAYSEMQAIDDRLYQLQMNTPFSGNSSSNW